MRYEIVVSGEAVGPALQATFDDLVVAVKGGRTTLTGELADPPALHGVLERVQDLGLELVELRRLEPERRRGSEGSAAASE